MIPATLNTDELRHGIRAWRPVTQMVFSRGNSHFIQFQPMRAISAPLSEMIGNLVTMSPDYANRCNFAKRLSTG
jgi:hypothetical protein